MDPTRPPTAWMLPDFFWMLLTNADALVQRVDPFVYHAMLCASLGACLSIRFGPPALRSLVAAPFIPTLGAALWMASRGRPELLSLALMASCPVMLWLARALGSDPMRSRLLDLEPPSAPP